MKYLIKIANSLLIGLFYTVEKIMPLWLRFWCLLGIHGLERTQYFGERHCSTCGGSYWGRVTENRTTRYLGKWKWYSAKKLAKIKAAGEMDDLICGTGKYSD